MKIVVAPDSFKESMSAKEVCDSIEKGLLSVSKDWEIVKSTNGRWWRRNIRSLN